MTAPAPAVPLPCAGRHRLYDLAKHRVQGASNDELEAARWEASTLCGRCPAPCQWLVKPPRARNAHGRRGQPRRAAATTPTP